MIGWPIRSALLIDYENVAHRALPDTIPNWVAWLERGEFDADTPGRRRRFVTKPRAAGGKSEVASQRCCKSAVDAAGSPPALLRNGREGLLTAIAARDRLIVALDFPEVEAARALVERLGPAVTFYKIGLELVTARGGLDLARELSDAGKRVFLDMKLLDIANTVERATRNAAASGATFLTVHAHDSKTLRAAMAGRAGTSLRLLAVTVLTNLDGSDLIEQGFAEAPAELVARRTRLAREAGCDGVVASGLEAAQVRAIVGPGIAIVTPGIRLPGAAQGDQARVATPQTAIAAGADYLVVGRPISGAPEARRVAESFVQAIEEALASGGPTG